MFILKVFLFFFVCLLAACGTFVLQTENSNQIKTEKQKAEFSLKMERSRCKGDCPAYKLNVKNDGKIIFDGIDSTEIKGTVKGNLSEEKMKQLVAEIEKANFFLLKNNYTVDSGNCPSDATDQTTVTLYIKLDEREKTITHYLGCWNAGNANDGSQTRIFPQELYNLENKIDEIVETKRWIGERK